MEIKREITCILCPVGCKAKVVSKGGKIVKIENLECPAGEDHVRKEIEAPMRDFFTTVRVRREHGFSVLPVRTDRPIPKEKMIDCALELAKIVIEPPVRMGDVIVKDLLGLGVNVIATKELGSSR